MIGLTVSTVISLVLSSVGKVSISASMSSLLSTFTFIDEMLIFAGCNSVAMLSAM